MEWSGESDVGSNSRFSWEPLTRIYRDVPDLVVEYCGFVKLDLERELDEESLRRNPVH